MKKILAVDNHPVVLKFMTDLLEKEGHRIMIAEDGLAAMEVLKTYVPDIIFVDLVMPNIDGKKLCMLIRSMPAMRDVYLVIMSAIAAEDNINPAELGADACIVKGPLNKMGQHVLTVIDSLERDCPEELSGRLIGVEDVYKRDVTKELLSTARYYEAVFDNMDDGILGLSSDGKVVYANPAAISIVGIAEENLLGFGFPEILGEIYGESLPSMTEQTPVSVNGKQVTLKEIRIRKDKKSSFVVLRDVSEQKRMEKSLRHAQKMEAVGELAGGIAHEFNNALAGVTGNVELMQLDVPVTADTKSYFESIRRCTDRMVKLTSQLLAYARGGKYQSRNLSVHDFIEDTLPLIMHKVDDSIRLKTDLSRDGMYVDADFSQLQMVLSAVLNNAFEAIEGEGRICISTELVKTGHGVLKNNSELKVGGYVCIAIEDNGKGMDEAAKKKIFEPFFSTKFQGRGLGMAATYGIVRNHGGTISIDSEIGKGTRVNICLPAVDCETEGTKKTRPQDTNGTGTVLLVEDEEMVMTVNKMLLERMGYRVLGAKTGEEAVNIGNTFEGDIDLAILDIVLPDMEGKAVYPILIQARPDLKVIVCSGYSIEGPAQEIMDAGAQDFIQKPFSFAALSEKLREVLEGQ